ncbi:MAG TPA: competence/damage-inducible protein A [Ignavibacteriales bacterium]|nr:competence/damage-inducible protein A [Ignavibacteriales bacterium]HEX3072305.1 competence/damage-inducible protein A [Ignavibacteriales bacterium]
MKAAILTIGDEILIGQTVNTNAAYIGAALTGIQIALSKCVSVGDNETEILNEMKDLWDKYDIIIATGGLGPTHDDITKNCIVKFFNTELVRNEEVMSDIAAYFKKRERIMSPTNESQALVPKNADIIRNIKGTAPGIWIERDKKIFVSLPGVPFEMREMIDSYIIPNLSAKFEKPDNVFKTTTLLTTGIPESLLYERLGYLNGLLEGAKLAFLPSQFGVKMRITVYAKNEETASNKLSEIEQRIRSLVGRYIYGKNEETLETVVARLLLERGLKIAVAESCTGGLISNLLTNISGSSAYFERGAITYSNAAKVEVLKVDEDYLIQYGSVSYEVVRQMAEGAKATSGNDIGLAVTGIMGPTGATPNKPVGLVYIGICDDKVCAAKKFIFGDDRILNKERTAQAALEMLRRHLLGISYDE